MTGYLLDTNILIRASNANDPNQALAIQAVACLLRQGNDCVITPQILVEFWVVATRPVEVNGLGWSVDQCQQEVRQFLEQFPLLEETPEIFSIWLRLVYRYEISGKKVHDARLAAAMLSKSIQHVLTFNVDDFAGIQEINALHPSIIMEA